MKVLVTGATGLIGGHVLRALRAAGCAVTGVSRRRPAGEAPDSWIEGDFADMTQPRDWLAHLDGVDAVVNCVGILREARAGDFERIHHLAPAALFAACEQRGAHGQPGDMRVAPRVVQISALGSAIDAPTGYWRSKGAAEADLRARRLDATILRPSLVYGDAGASSRVFMTMATLPLLAMPMAHAALVQPIHVDDLAALVPKLLLSGAATPSQPAPALANELTKELAAVGPRAMTMAGYLAALRTGLRAPAGLVLSLPLPLARMVARVAELIPSSALTPESLLMLERSADGGNTADAAPARALLGRALRDPSGFAGPAQRAAAVLTWGLPALTAALALLWLITAFVSWFGWPRDDSLQWLAACGVPASWREPVLLAASLADAAVGLLLLAQLLRPRRWVWPLQLALVGAYTAIMTVCLPGFWLHPFGPLSKNLPLLVLFAVLWRLAPEE